MEIEVERLSEREVRGFVHLHLTEWNLPLEQLVEEHVARGHDFLCVADHPSEMDRREFGRRLDRCRVLSNVDFMCIYGLEGRTGSGPHLMGLGVEHYVDVASLTLAEGVEAIRAAGAVAVLARPSNDRARWDSLWEVERGYYYYVTMYRNVSKLDGAYVVDYDSFVKQPHGFCADFSAWLGKEYGDRTKELLDEVYRPKQQIPGLREVNPEWRSMADEGLGLFQQVPS